MNKKMPFFNTTACIYLLIGIILLLLTPEHASRDYLRDIYSHAIFAVSIVGIICGVYSIKKNEVKYVNVIVICLNFVILLCSLRRIFHCIATFLWYVDDPEFAHERNEMIRGQVINIATFILIIVVSFFSVYIVNKFIKSNA
ncbi:MAG: hypothetical protein K9M75_00855 [Phycisphaerae bacterium]|nr:hypothetical protein [Phycisphaerae bacterium]